MRLAAIVLAAGRSVRFGADKRLAIVRGRPLITWALTALDGFDFAQKIAVVRPDDPVEPLLAPFDVTAVVNPRADDGMGMSLACGVAALDAVEGVFIALADMPDIPSGVYNDLAARFAAGDADIVVPRHRGQAGHPVLFGAACFSDLKALIGDRGGWPLIASGHYRVAYVDITDGGVLHDIDRATDFPV